MVYPKCSGPGWKPTSRAVSIYTFRNHRVEERLYHTCLLPVMWPPHLLRIDTLCHEGIASQKIMRFSHLTFRKQNMPQTV